jgi:putative FmdB family regulatory protein
MPLYEYRCSQCEGVFEVMQKFSDPPLTVHEGCGGAVERLVSAPGLQFKGSGWYITDYARSGSGQGKSEPAKSEPAKSETKSEPAAAKTESSSSAKKD